MKVIGNKITAESKDDVKEEYMRVTLTKYCTHFEYDDFREWIEEEGGFDIYESSNRSWIRLKTGRVIGTETLYKLYKTSLTD